MSPSPDTRRDLLSAGGLAVLAIAYLIANRAYPFDAFATPGPGVFPLAAGTLMFGAAVGQALAAWRTRPPARPGPAGSTAPRRVLALMAVLIGYPIAAGTVGFLAASFAVVLATSRLLGARDWVGPVALALGVTAAAYALFVVWLGVPLPAAALP